MPQIGPMELAIVLIIALLIVGPKKLPALGRSLGGGMREVKDSIPAAGTASRPPAIASEAPAPEKAEAVCATARKLATAGPGTRRAVNPLSTPVGSARSD